MEQASWLQRTWRNPSLGKGKVFCSTTSCPEFAHEPSGCFVVWKELEQFQFLFGYTRCTAYERREIQKKSTFSSLFLEARIAPFFFCCWQSHHRIVDWCCAFAFCCYFSAVGEPRLRKVHFGRWPRQCIISYVLPFRFAFSLRGTMLQQMEPSSSFMAVDLPWEILRSIPHWQGG